MRRLVEGRPTLRGFASNTCSLRCLLVTLRSPALLDRKSRRPTRRPTSWDKIPILSWLNPSKSQMTRSESCPTREILGRHSPKSGYQPQCLHRAIPPPLTASLAMRDRYPPNGSVMLWFAWRHVGCNSPGQSGSGADRHDGNDRDDGTGSIVTIAGVGRGSRRLGSQYRPGEPAGSHRRPGRRCSFRWWYWSPCCPGWFAAQLLGPDASRAVLGTACPGGAGRPGHRPGSRRRRRSSRPESRRRFEPLSFQPPLYAWLAALGMRLSADFDPLASVLPSYVAGVACGRSWSTCTVDSGGGAAWGWSRRC